MISPNMQNSNLRISSVSTQYLLPKTYQRTMPCNIYQKFRLFDKENLIFDLVEERERPEKLRSSIGSHSNINLRCSRKFRTLGIYIYKRFHSRWIPKIISFDPSIRSISLDASSYNLNVAQIAEILKSIKNLPFLNELVCKFRHDAENEKYYEAFLDYMMDTRNGIKSTWIRVGNLSVSRSPRSYKISATAYNDDYQYIVSRLRFFRNFYRVNLKIELRTNGSNMCGRIKYIPEKLIFSLDLWKSSSIECIEILIAKLFDSKKIGHVSFSLSGNSRDEISSKNQINANNALNNTDTKEFLSKLREFKMDAIDLSIIQVAFMGISHLIRSFNFTFDVKYKSLDSLFDFFKFLAQCSHLKKFAFKFYLENYDERIISELMKSLKSFEKIDCFDAKFCEPVSRSFHVNELRFFKNEEEITYFSIKKDFLCKPQLYLPLYKNEKFLDTIFKKSLNDYQICLELKQDLSGEMMILSDLKERIKGLDYVVTLMIDSNDKFEKFTTYSKTNTIDSRLRIIEKTTFISPQIFLSFFEQINKNGWIVEEIFMEYVQPDEDSDDKFFCELIEVFKTLDFLKLLAMKMNNERFSEFHDCYNCISQIKREKLEEYCKSKKFEVRFYPGFMILEKN